MKRLLFLCSVMIGLTGASTALWAQPAGFAYAANVGSGDLSAYSIDGTTGALTEVLGSPFQAGTTPRSITVHPTGMFAYVALYLSGTVAAYTIDRTSGPLTPVVGSPFPAGIASFSVTTTPGPLPAVR